MTTVKGKVNGFVNGTVDVKSKTNGKITVGRPLATIKVSDIEGGHKITVTDPNGIQELDVMDGVNGKDGMVPHVGGNGNWFIGETDTGIKAKYDIIGWRGTGTSAEKFNDSSNEAQGDYSHAEGYDTYAQGNSSHAEGHNSHAKGDYSHAEGRETYAVGLYSHAEGRNSNAEGGSSHAEGSFSHAQGDYSHAEGHETHAEGYGSHAEGYGSHAAGKSQHVQGEYNITDPEYNPDAPLERSKYVHIVGNGIDDSNPSNAHTLDWDGNAWFQGEVMIGGTGQDDPEAKTLATKEYVDEKAANLQSDWNQNDPIAPDYVKNRPFYYGSGYEIVKWDGSEDGRDVCSLGDYNACKIAETSSITKDELKNTIFGTKRGDICLYDPDPSINTELGDLGVLVLNYGTMIQTDYGAEDFAYGIIVYVDDEALSILSSNGLDFPSTGIYASQNSDESFELTIYKQNMVKKIPKAFMPTIKHDDVEGLEDYVNEKISNIDIPGGSGGGAAIIDVVELPTENVNEDVFYRLLTGTFYYNGTPQGGWTCHVVESLPTEGIPVTSDMVHVVLYYAVDTGTVSGYISSALSGAVGVPAGWYPVEALAQAFGLAWGGIIWSEHEVPIDGVNRLVLSYAIYQFKREWNNTSEKIGWKGTATAGSEIFNSLTNKATGDNSHAEGNGTYAEGHYSHAEGSYSHAEGRYSHAEGYSTSASGNASHAEGGSTYANGGSSHAEGYDTIANGNYSHAEGYESHAEGQSSHAEGHETHAEGYGSHAEGLYSHAEGDFSHAEGWYSHAQGENSHAEGRSTLVEGHRSHAEGYCTHALGHQQHVQGQYNKPLENYAHIVGNGTSDSDRSNAHTLDWEGNAWFAGDIYIGGTGQDDENAKTLVTKEYVDEKSVQPDWNQNDETAPDYVKNRTHWVEHVFEPIVYNSETCNKYKAEVDLSGFGMGTLRKISETTLPPREQLESANVIADVSDLSGTTGYVLYLEDESSYTGMDIYKWVCQSDTNGNDDASGYFCYFPFSGDTDIGLTIPSVGLYMSSIRDGGYNDSIVTIENKTVNKIDKMFIEDNGPHFFDYKYIGAIPLDGTMVAFYPSSIVDNLIFFGVPIIVQLTFQNKASYSVTLNPQKIENEQTYGACGTIMYYDNNDTICVISVSMNKRLDGSWYIAAIKLI